MQSTKSLFKPQGSHDWTAERVQKLGTQDIEQLRDNASRLGAEQVVSLCEAALQSRPRGARGRGRAVAPKNARRLISRGKAFQARGVFLADEAASWGGVRKTDGMVVMSLWASAVHSEEGGCSYLLWAPDGDGERSWFATPAGKERLEHCKLALERGGAEGLLVHGERLEDRLPEDKARSVHGVDPEVLLHFRVERRGAEYWAVWGARGEKQES